MDLSTTELEPLLRNPIDLVEALVTAKDWAFERPAECELNANVAGSWCDYSLSFTWHDDIEAVHMAIAFDMRVAADKRREIQVAMARINEQIMLGHFDLWSDDGVILFRHSLMLQGGAQVTEEQCDALIHLGVESCERYYPAFQFVIWAGKTAEEAIAASMFEVAGSA